MDRPSKSLLVSFEEERRSWDSREYAEVTSIFSFGAGEEVADGAVQESGFAVVDRERGGAAAVEVDGVGGAELEEDLSELGRGHAFADALLAAVNDEEEDDAVFADADGRARVELFPARLDDARAEDALVAGDGVSGAFEIDAGALPGVRMVHDPRLAALEHDEAMLKALFGFGIALALADGEAEDVGMRVRCGEGREEMRVDGELAGVLFKEGAGRLVVGLAGRVAIRRGDKEAEALCFGIDEGDEIAKGAGLARRAREDADAAEGLKDALLARAELGDGAEAIFVRGAGG